MVLIRLPIAMVAASAVLTTACTMGPNYKRPIVEIPSAHRGAAGATQAGASASLADLKWFDVFRDDTLTGLVNTALQQNFEVRIAAERVLQARAAYGISRADRWPSVDASAGVTAARASQRGANRGLPSDADTGVSYIDAGFSIGWELDVWGRVRRLNEAARAEYLATEEARRGVITTLVADVSETYLQLRALDLELEIARRTKDVATDSLRLTETRRTGGVASGLDVRQAEQLLFTATGRIASLEREIAETENTLSLLLGRPPGDVPRGRPLEAIQAPPSVPAGLPSALLERRPDVRQAEQQLVAANARIGAARAEYFPRISLTGFLGVQSRALTELLTGAAGVASGSLGAAAPVFNAGRTRANVQLAQAVQREAVVQYQRAIYTALRDVSDGLVAHTKITDERGEQEKLVQTLTEARRLATERYQGGLDSYLPVLDAQRNLFQGELELARLRQQELTAIVQLYRALGGGWEPS
jgi:NodT family efflux transporter outer membrane factor (OMF) lipoprotein